MAGEQTIRLAFFLGVLTIVAVWELIAPRRTLTDNKGRRWFVNLSLVAIDTAVVRFLLPVLPVSLALLSQEHGWGVLNVIILPNWIKVALIGPPDVAVIIFEVALNATSQFNNGTILIPESVDRWLRLVVVTPDMVTERVGQRQ